jgi:5-hydroxyisourate hydrolase-like protein (transthyretin family)
MKISEQKKNKRSSVLIVVFLILNLIFTLNFVYTQTIDQKLSLVNNERIIGGTFVIDYQIKGTGLGTAKTLGSLNVDVIYDTTMLRFNNGSNWLLMLSDENGYSRSIKSNASETGKYHTVRIILTAPNVSDSGYVNAIGYDIENQFVTLVTINFTILSTSGSALLDIKAVTNQVGIFDNPHNQPNTFDITSFGLSVPQIIEEPMPASLMAFNSNVEKNNVKLTWKTSQETNNKGFEVQKSDVKNSDWNNIGFVTGNGTISTPRNYLFEDKNLNTGKYKYRLKQIDNNGNFEYHNLEQTVVIGVPVKFNISQNYPNPFNPATKIDFEVPVDSKVNITIYDNTGREMQSLVNEKKQAGYYTVVLNGSSLSSGSYFYRIICESGADKFVETKKMIMVK